MKKSLICIVLAIVIISNLVGNGLAESKTDSVKTLTVYCYDSFLGDWGPGAAIEKGFEEKTGIQLDLVSCGSAVDLLEKVRYEGSSTEADMVLGIGDTTKVDFSIFAPAVISSNVKLAKSLSIQEGVLVPFNYGIFAFVADTTKITDLPTSLSDLTDPRYKDNVILIDPRTSSVGTGLLLWTLDVYGEEGYLDWWKAMKDNALTISDSWSSAYGLFTEGEAPLVISYTTSPVYHVMYEDTTTIRALEFTDGHHECVEYAGILKTSNHKEEAQAFLDYLLTDGQEEIAVDNSMFPANAATVLPSAFDYAVIPSLIFSSDRNMIGEKLDSYLASWSEAMVK